jgi:hypothetical protein
LTKLSILNPSAGINYHLRAIWNRRLWRPFVDYVAAWLSDWRKDSRLIGVRTLVLIGPNAGYTLPKDFVRSFESVVVVEPDPLAYVLFESRFQCRAKWVRRDYFGLDQKPPHPQALTELFVSYPNAAFLFCNILGQLPVLLRESKGVDVERYMLELGTVLSGARSVPVASYHDRYSRRMRRPHEYVDHLTGNLFAHTRNKKEFPWRITSRDEHQIEFARHE